MSRCGQKDIISAAKPFNAFEDSIPSNMPQPLTFAPEEILVNSSGRFDGSTYCVPQSGVYQCTFQINGEMTLDIVTNLKLCLYKNQSVIYEVRQEWLDDEDNGTRIIEVHWTGPLQCNDKLQLRLTVSPAAGQESEFRLEAASCSIVQLKASVPKCSCNRCRY